MVLSRLEMKRPFFSCVIPVKGARPYFDAALESLRLQEMGDDLELIVQDADVEPDEGQSDALNIGFAKARGEWLFWLNADDVLFPGALKSVKDYVTSSESDAGNRRWWISGNLVYLDVRGGVLRCTRERGRARDYAGLPVRVFGPSSFFRREMFEQCGPFDTTLHYCMDTDMWCRFREAGYWYDKIPRYLWGFRVHGDSKTSGALKGAFSSRMREEIEIIRARYCLEPTRLRTFRLRLMRLIDGSTLASLWDTLRSWGKDWKEFIK